jgi:hypothetical protein
VPTAAVQSWKAVIPSATAPASHNDQPPSSRAPNSASLTSRSASAMPALSSSPILSARGRVSARPGSRASAVIGP